MVWKAQLCSVDKLAYHSTAHAAQARRLVWKQLTLDQASGGAAAMGGTQFRELASQ